MKVTLKEENGHTSCGLGERNPNYSDYAEVVQHLFRI